MELIENKGKRGVNYLAFEMASKKLQTLKIRGGMDPSKSSKKIIKKWYELCPTWDGEKTKNKHFEAQRRHRPSNFLFISAFTSSFRRFVVASSRVETRSNPYRFTYPPPHSPFSFAAVSHWAIVEDKINPSYRRRLSAWFFSDQILSQDFVEVKLCTHCSDIHRRKTDVFLTAFFRKLSIFFAKENVKPKIHVTTF